MKTQQQQSGFKSNRWIIIGLFLFAGIIPEQTVYAQDSIFLSDMNWLYAYCGYGTVRKDRTERGPSIKIGGVSYTKGIGAWAVSAVYYDLKKQYTSFLSDIGIDDFEGGSGPTVIFKVFCDGRLVFTSSVITTTMNAVKVDIPVSGVNELCLVVEDAGDGKVGDNAVWANARLKPGIPQTATAYLATIRLLHNGNSLSPDFLTNTTMQLALSSGYDHKWCSHNVYGDQLKVRWNQGTDSTTPRGRIMSGKYTHIDIQPNSDEYELSSNQRDTMKKYTKLFYDLAKLYNISPYLYCYWRHRSDLASEQNNVDAAFGEVADFCGSDFVVIPAGRVYYNIQQACLSGIIKDWDPSKWYADGTHATNFGYYIDALTHFATIFQQSPEGLPTFNKLRNTPTVIDTSAIHVSDSTFLKMQRIVWNTVKAFSHAKIDTTLLPKAGLTSNKTITAVNSPVSFDASSSAPISGKTITKYIWSFGDVISGPNKSTVSFGYGGSYDDGHVTPKYETSTPFISHAYSKAGTYFARLVVLQDNGKTSSSCILITVTTSIDTVVPSTPTNLTSSNITSVGFTLSWTASTDNIGVTSYEIFRNGVLAGVSYTTSFNVTGLSANTTYAMTVKAKDGAGNVSAASTALNVTTSAPDNQTPTVPTGLGSSSITTTSFTISWSASSDNVGVTGYEVFRNGSSIGTPTGTTLSLTGLACGTTYAMTVRAKDAAGNWSAQSTALNVSTSTCSDTQAPTVPSGSISSSIAQTSFTLSWTASTDNVGVTGYEVFRNGTSIGTTASTTMSVAGLTCATIYAMKVRARDAAGNWSAQSTALNVTTSACSDTQAPTAPTGLTSSSIAQTSFTLSWTASTDNVGVVSYEIFKGGVSAGTTTSSTLNLTGLTANTTYAMTVKAKDAAGNISAAGSVLNVTTSPLTVTAVGEGINLYPNPVADIVNITNIEPGSIVSLYDMKGILLVRKNAESDLLQLNVGSLSKGVYIIKVNSESRVLKFIKE